VLRSLARFLSVMMGFCGNVDKHGKIHLSKLPHYRSTDSNTKRNIILSLEIYRGLYKKKKETKFNRHSMPPIREIFCS